MINELIEKIAIIEYAYGLTLDIDFLNSTSEEYESLIKEANQLSFEELLYVHYLIAICNDHLNNDAKAIPHFKLCLDYSYDLNNITFIGKCFLYLYKFYLPLDELGKYNYCFDKSEEIFLKHKNYIDLSKLYIFAICHKVKINAYSDEVLLLIAKTLENITYFENEFAAQILMTLGSIHSIYLKDNYQSIELYKKSLNIATKYNYTRLKLMINYHIASGYINLNRSNEACTILENLLSNDEKLPSITMNCVFTLELINLYIDTESNLDLVSSMISSLEDYSKLVSKSVSMQIKSQLLLIKCRLALLDKDKSFDIMINWITEANEIYESYKTSYRFSHADYLINSLFGDTYYTFGYYDKALFYHSISLNLSSMYEIRYVISSHQKISRDYACLNEYKEAFIHMEKIDTIRSTIQHANLLENYTKVYKEYEDFKENEETKNQFFTNLSHELKTPINIIYSSIQLLNIFKDTNELKFKQYYLKHERSVTQNCLRILKLIDNLIDTTKIDSGSFKLTFVNYDIVKLIEDITLSTLPYVEMKNLNIIFDTEIEQLEIKCDPYAIERIMLNLLSNAIKFTSDGGNINVVISLRDAYVCIKVNDDGIGIPPSMRDNIFDRFTQVDNSLNRRKEGSGIGLSLVKSIVELHNGRIYINSKILRGSEFNVLLPNIKTFDDFDKSICNSYFPNTSKVSAEFSDIYELS